MGNVIISKTVNYGGLPYDVKSIGEAAFFECKALETLNFNAIACEDYFEDLETPIIPAFYGLKINTVNIGNRVTRLPAGFIMGCTGFSAILKTLSIIFTTSQRHFTFPSTLLMTMPM